MAINWQVEQDRSNIDRAEEEAYQIIEDACEKTGWYLSGEPLLEADDGDECRAGLTLSISDMPTFACGHAVADALADKLVALAAKLDKRTGRIRFPRIGATERA